MIALFVAVVADSARWSEFRNFLAEFVPRIAENPVTTGAGCDCGNGQGNGMRATAIVALVVFCRVTSRP